MGYVQKSWLSSLLLTVVNLGFFVYKLVKFRNPWFNIHKKSLGSVGLTQYHPLFPVIHLYGKIWFTWTLALDIILHCYMLKHFRSHIVKCTHSYCTVMGNQTVSSLIYYRICRSRFDLQNTNKLTSFYIFITPLS